jgi:hypothetical protein
VHENSVDAGHGFRMGELVHVYSFGGPNVPRYLGRARIISDYDRNRLLYVVGFDDSDARVEVVARSLQGDPAVVLADLKAHWAARISTAFFGRNLPVTGEVNVWA